MTMTNEKEAMPGSNTHIPLSSVFLKKALFGLCAYSELIQIKLVKHFFNINTNYSALKSLTFTGETKETN